MTKHIISFLPGLMMDWRYGTLNVRRFLCINGREYEIIYRRTFIHRNNY